MGMICQKEVMLYGLDRHHDIIDGIISDMEIETSAFDVKLILAEAVTNAFYHGNREDCTKPIYIRYWLEQNLLSLEVEDSGEGVSSLYIPDHLEDDQLLDDGGRGLYLIRCFADSVEMIDNTMHIAKTLACP